MLRYIKRVAFLTVIVQLVGCGGYALQAEEFQKYLNDPDAPRIAYQVCLPEKKVSFEEIKLDVTDLPFKQALAERADMSAQVRAGRKYPPMRLPGEVVAIETGRLWKPRSDFLDIALPYVMTQEINNTAGVRSAGGSTAYLEDSSETDQPIFFEFSHARLGDLVALSIRSDSNKSSEYWFIPPKNIQKGLYTEWMMPVSEESPFKKGKGPSTWWLLVHSEKAPVYTPEHNAPRIRYMLITDKEFSMRDNSWMRRWDAARLQYISEHGASPDLKKYRVIDVRSSIVPNCS